MKEHLFHVVRVNCDCASYWWGRFRPPQGSGYWMRCRYCRRSLGDMQYEYHGTIRAKYEDDAVAQVRARVIAERRRSPL